MAETNKVAIESNEKKRVRSPAYPALSLEDAVDRAKILYEKEAQGKHPMPLSAIAKDWDYSSDKNGMLLTSVSALKQYGLLEDIPESSPRQVRLTQAGIIVSAYPITSPERTNALRTAALAPRIYKTLWEKYGWPLPSYETVSAPLIVQEGFNRDMVPGLIQKYESTIKFAKLDSGDKLEVETPPKDDVGSSTNTIKGGKDTLDDLMTTMMQGFVTPAKQNEHAEKQSRAFRDFAIPLDDGGAVVMRVPFPLNFEDFDTLVQTLELWEPKLTGKPRRNKIHNQE